MFTGIVYTLLLGYRCLDCLQHKSVIANHEQLRLKGIDNGTKVVGDVNVCV
jgi:hypothetical protein